MREPAGSFPLASVSFGGRKLGAGTALVDEDLLRILLLDASDGEKTLQLRYESIAGVGLSDGSVIVTCRDSRNLVASTRDAPAFRATLLAACRALPEVTRALRALGSRRSIRGARRNPTANEGRFFAPFIAARRASMDARDAQSVIAAFDAHRLAALMGDSIAAFAAERGGGYAPRQRALEAEISDAAEPLSMALDELADRAAAASADADDLNRWRAWAESVQRVFEAADRVWVMIDPVVTRQ